MRSVRAWQLLGCQGSLSTHSLTQLWGKVLMCSPTTTGRWLPMWCCMFAPYEGWCRLLCPFLLCQLHASLHSIYPLMGVMCSVHAHWCTSPTFLPVSLASCYPFLTAFFISLWKVPLKMFIQWVEESLR